jgi:hypothetical protein
MKLFISLIAFIILSACASVNIDQTPLAVATHADLQGAAAYAQANGYPDRAAVWLAIDAQLKACNDAITAAEPKGTQATPKGPAMAFEMAAEAVGQVSGIPSAVKIHCAALPLITFPVIPKL